MVAVPLLLRAGIVGGACSIVDYPLGVIMTITRLSTVVAVILAFVAIDLHAGGPWTQKKGKTRLSFGFSRKTAGTLWRENKLETPDDSTLVDGLFHDFQYAYLSAEIGIIDNLELSGTINYLWGYERVTSNPNTGQVVPPYWELNQGFTDSWLNLKYQFLEGEVPMAVMLSSRFPDLYDEPGHVYARHATRTYTTTFDTLGADGTDSLVRLNQKIVEPTSEWRGLLKRDFGVHLLVGHSFGGDGYIEGQLAYNFRQAAYADQVIISIDGGYTIPISQGWAITPKILFDYTGGVGNGLVPDESDRFQFRDQQGRPRKNYYFNNGRYGRLYGSVGVGGNQAYGLEIGAGRWLFGDGSARYWETFAQLSYQL